MSRLSQIFHNMEKSKVLEGTVQWLDGVTTISNDQKKELALDVIKILHLPVYGPLADAEVAAVGGAIEFVLARVRAWAQEDLVHAQKPVPAPVPTPQPDPTSVEYDTEDEAMAHLIPGYPLVVKKDNGKFIIYPQIGPLPGVQVYPKP